MCWLFKPLTADSSILDPVSLHSKRFRGVGEQRKTKERNRNGILPARNWGESQNKKEGVEEGKCDTIFAIFLLSVWSLSCPNSKDFALFDLFVLSQAIIHAPLSSLWRFLFYRSRLCSSQLAYFILYYLVLPWVYEGFFRWQSTGFD